MSTIMSNILPNAVCMTPAISMHDTSRAHPCFVLMPLKLSELYCPSCWNCNLLLTPNYGQGAVCQQGCPKGCEHLVLKALFHFVSFCFILLHFASMSFNELRFILFQWAPMSFEAIKAFRTVLNLAGRRPLAHSWKSRTSYNFNKRDNTILTAWEALARSREVHASCIDIAGVMQTAFGRMLNIIVLMRVWAHSWNV